MSKLEKLLNGVMLGTLTFVFLACTSIGVSQFVKATGNLGLGMSAGFTLAMVYGVYVLVKFQTTK